MDVDDLDRWLDEDDALDGDRRRRPATPPGAAQPGRRIPWRWIGIAAAGLWMAVVAAVVLGGDDPTATPTDHASAPQPALTDPDVMDPDLIEPPEDLIEPAADGPSMASPAPTAGAPVAEPPGTAPPSPTPDQPTDGWPPHLAAGAVRAMRQHLTTAGPPATYLEWATPTGARRLDRDVWLMELEAVWLVGDDTDLDRADVGSWVVALTESGQALAPPWPVPHDRPDPPALEPPTGTTRLPEVQQALIQAGWTDVTAVAADPHPLLADVLVALVEGIAPTGQGRAGWVLWLDTAADGTLTPMAVRP